MSGGDDFVIDAPWRSIRNYVPVLFFIPDLKSGQISKFELWMHDKRTHSPAALIFRTCWVALTRHRALDPGNHTKYKSLTIKAEFEARSNRTK